MAPSVETRVRVERLLNIMATVWPARAVLLALSLESEATWALLAAALRMRAVNSLVVRSLMEVRWRGGVAVAVE